MRIFNKETGAFMNVHPTFLYESILDVSIFVILMLMRKKRKFKGQLTYIYFILYGLGRALIEGVRTDSLYFGNLRISQILSIFLVVICLIMYIFGDKCRRKD
jgi:phosphatidylglycerol:prolipoprotein diacylglycerol transferase